ncbi:MAG TPA: isoleucine--tRNA ligase [Thermoanaerobaculia bacterium]|nr:isoleucine--tRNA ligase [Thermoanaerobaculia bacterium]
MSKPSFPQVETGYPFPRLELEVLEHWRRERIFERSLERTRGGREFVFYDGPATANNAPHVGHVVTRVIKDLIPRYRTMRGEYVARKGGWDTHGLPVEIEVEKRLGLTGKRQIEDYGIAEFNRRCLESVDVYEKQWREMVERVGHWIDLDPAYLTYTNEYIESVWWALARLAETGLLERGYKIQHYCGRCGTPLSSHEVAQNYKEVDDPSVWVLFPLRPDQSVVDLEGRFWPLGPEVRMVAWTTTPWTLLSHAGLAINPALTYRLVRHPARHDLLILTDGLEQPVPFVTRSEDGKAQRIDLRQGETIARFCGESLVGLRYDRPLRVHPGGTSTDAGNDVASDERGWLVVSGEYVTAADGTGIVHTAPLFGEDDYRTGQTWELPQIQAIDAAGRVCAGAGLDAWAGLWFKDADPPIAAELERSGRLLHQERYRHSYAFCWRCDRPLLYYATDSWFVRTTARKDRLIENNRRIDWHPQHVGTGRFGDWLENLVDWALSRNRYWGTPLPIWVCDECGLERAIGSYAELHQAAGRPLPENPYDRAQFDPHRPFIDAFEWPCRACGEGTLRRVEQVIDAWFDSGAMPFAQHHYPFENRELFERRFPADFISEAVDQTRGWFYTLHAIATLLFDDLAFRHCVVLGHVNDESGRKMSKRLGNVVDPMAVIAETGADALRWYFCLNNPEQPARFSARLVREAAQSFLLPLWNALSFFSIYANLDGWRPGRPEPVFAERPALDRWILLRLASVVREVTAALEGYRVADAARAVAVFTDDLCNWYIRRSRDRFWAPAGGDEQAGNRRTAGGAADKESTYQALYEVLVTLARLLAPFTPFAAEILHRNLVRSVVAGAASSVHLEDWPAPAPGREEPALEASMGLVQRIVRWGHAARNGHGLRTRQPLASVTVVASDRAFAAAVEPHLDLVRDELNVREVRFAERRSDYVHHDVLPVFPKLGPRFGRRMPAVKAALAAADGDALAERLEAAGAIDIELDGERTTLGADEVEVRLHERAGMAIQGDRDLLVALDTELTPDLVMEGLAREVVHRVQRARKEADLDYADRIRIRYRAEAELKRAIEMHQEWIAGETLAVDLREEAAGASGLDAAEVEGHELELAIERV